MVVTKQAQERAMEICGPECQPDTLDAVAELIQQVSNVAKEATAFAIGIDRGTPDIVAALKPFILPEPVDPLVEAIKDLQDEPTDGYILPAEDTAERLRRALARQGLCIVPMPK